MIAISASCFCAVIGLPWRLIFFYFLLCPSWGPLTPTEVTFSDDFPSLKPSRGSRSPHYALWVPSLSFHPAFLAWNQMDLCSHQGSGDLSGLPRKQAGKWRSRVISSLAPASPERGSFPSTPFCILDSFRTYRKPPFKLYINYTSLSSRVYIIMLCYGELSSCNNSAYHLTLSYKILTAWSSMEVFYHLVYRA